MTSTEPGKTMAAAWYDRQGPAAVLRTGELPAPWPAGGEVRIAVSLSGISPGDAKKRAGTRGSLMPYPRVIPHSDAAGIIDAVGPGVDEARVGERVWVFGAQSYRPFGTAARWTVVPSAQAIALPDQVSDETGAALGIPGITAHRAAAPGGVDRIVEVALSENGELDASVVASDAVIATYSSLSDRIDLPFLPLLFANVTIRLLGSDDFPFPAKQDAARDLTAAAAAGALSVRVGAVFPLADIAAAHERVEAGRGGRVLVRADA